MANSKQPYQSTHTGAEIDAGINLLDKNSATQGQVLTADGRGGASWQNASGGSGGGTQLYRHVITSDVQIISTRSAAYNSIGNIDTDNGIICINFYDASSGMPAFGANWNWLWQIGMDENGNELLLLSRYNSMSNTWIKVTVTTSSDTVTPL